MEAKAIPLTVALCQDCQPQFEFSRIDPNQYVNQAPRGEYRKLPELLPRNTDRVK